MTAAASAFPPAHMPPMPPMPKAPAPHPPGVPFPPAASAAAPTTTVAAAAGPTTTVAAARPPPTFVDVPPADRGLSAASLLKKVVESRGHKMQDIQLRPRVLSPHEVVNPTDRSIQVDHHDFKGKKFAKIPVVYEVVIERTVLDAHGDPVLDAHGNELKEPVEVLQIPQDWYTDLEMPTTWGGRDEEHFQTMIEAHLKAITTQLNMISQAAKGSGRSFLGIQLPDTALNRFRMQNSFIIGTITYDSSHFYGQTIQKIPGAGKRPQLSYMPRSEEKEHKTKGLKHYGEAIDPVTEQTVHLPRRAKKTKDPSTKEVTYELRNPRRIVMSRPGASDDLAQLQERRDLLHEKEEATGPAATLADITDLEDRTFVEDALRLQCTECLDDLYGVSGDPQATLEYYHPDLTESAISTRRELKEAAEKLPQYEDLRARSKAWKNYELARDNYTREYAAAKKTGNPLPQQPTPPRVPQLTPWEARIVYRDSANQVKSYNLMEQRARSTLIILQEAHKTLQKALALLETDPTAPHNPQTQAIAAKSRELEGQIRDLGAYIDRCFPPRSPAATVALTPPPAATVVPASPPPPPGAPPLPALPPDALEAAHEAPPSMRASSDTPVVDTGGIAADTAAAVEGAAAIALGEVLQPFQPATTMPPVEKTSEESEEEYRVFDIESDWIDAKPLPPLEGEEEDHESPPPKPPESGYAGVD